MIHFVSIRKWQHSMLFQQYILAKLGSRSWEPGSWNFLKESELYLQMLVEPELEPSKNFGSSSSYGIIEKM